MTGVFVMRRSPLARPGAGAALRAEEAVGAARQLPCDARTAGLVADSLRSLRSLHSDRGDEIRGTKRAARAATRPALLGASDARNAAPAPGRAVVRFAVRQEAIAAGDKSISNPRVWRVAGEMGSRSSADGSRRPLSLEAFVRLESPQDRLVVAWSGRWAAAPAGALRRGEERTAELGARSALPFSFSPPLSERSERSERSESGGARSAGAPQRTRRAAPGTPLKPAGAAAHRPGRAHGTAASHVFMEKSR